MPDKIFIQNQFSNTSPKRQGSFFGPVVQAKLSINQPNDVYEQEADAVADKVMRMDNTASQPSFFSPVSVQRKCAECEDEEKNALRKESSNTTIDTSAQTENYISSPSDGKPLSKNDKTFFESRMGYDFSNVRIHNDTAANQSAKNIHALAYTHGNDIVFDAGQYQPNTSEGKKLLAHELTHVVQQSSGLATAALQRYDGTGGAGPGTHKPDYTGGAEGAGPVGNESNVVECNGMEVNDEIVQSIIDEALKLNNDNTDMAHAYLYQERKKHCCDSNWASAEHYMWARKECGGGLPVAAMKILIIMYSVFKIGGGSVALEGECTPTPTSSEQRSWAYKGAYDGRADYKAKNP